MAQLQGLGGMVGDISGAPDDFQMRSRTCGLAAFVSVLLITAGDGGYGDPGFRCNIF
ncbi:MAG: hypothetical protein V8Q27_03825 [Eubacteriales bacterium]